MTTSLRDLSSGSLYIISSMSDSIIERSARAPVPNFKAFSAIASTAPSVNLNFAPSRAKSFVYWRMREFFVFVRMWTKSDFERGFIRAEVVSYDDLIACGSHTAAKEKGLIRLEGKDYVVKDGDIMLFRFNV